MVEYIRKVLAAAIDISWRDISPLVCVKLHFPAFVVAF